MKGTMGIAACLAAGAALAQAPAIETVRVPGGCYQMGNLSGEKHEQPVHRQCVRDFEIGRTEVTQAQWQALMGNNPSRYPNPLAPVEMVSWNDAQEFLRRLNAAGGGRWRLPTEAEWEYVCRSGGKDETWAGTNAPQEVSGIAWFNKGEAGNMTHPVGTKKPNGLGIHDLSGNVWEWTQTNFATPYGNEKTEPKYVIRGGSWDGKVNYVRCGIRNRYEAERKDPRIGLRVVREP